MSLPTDEGCAFVTGSSRGIGAASARALAEDGWSVAINYSRDEEGADETVSAIEEAGGSAVAVQGDVGEGEAVDQALATAQERFGPVLTLVNNAGTRADDLLINLDDEEWSKVIEVNLNGPSRLIRRTLHGMLKARFGRIVNIASVVGPRANAGQANYAAAKAGLIGMTKTVAAEVAKRGVTVNAVAPGFIATEMTEDLPQGGLLDHIPAKRTGTPEEVAACVRFLASEDAGYVTGTTLTVDGGLSA